MDDTYKRQDPSFEVWQVGKHSKSEQCTCTEIKRLQSHIWYHVSWTSLENTVLHY